MPAYQFRLTNGGGTYVTDALTVADAQAELSAFFMRPVLVINIDGNHVHEASSADDKNENVMS